jgi:hypothetical protein
MTVVVDTPSGPRSGSSVTEVKLIQFRKGTLSSSAYTTKVKGEAVAVEMPGGRTLFALLASAANPDLGPENFAPCGYDTHSPTAMDELRTLQAEREPVELPAKCYPMLVTYRDARDPTSVEILDPSTLSTSFGEGTFLRSITLEITSDDLTSGISKRMPPFGEKTGYAAWARQLPWSDPRVHIGPEHFLRNGKY